MELPCSNIEKILTFSQKKVLLLFPKAEPCTFKAQKNDKKIFIFREMEPCSSSIKTFLIFLMFQESETLKSFWYLRRCNFLSPNPTKTKSIHTEKKNSLYLRKWNFLTIKFKNSLYFRKCNPARFSPSSKNKKAT